jgi:hypothetical protein
MLLLRCLLLRCMLLLLLRCLLLLLLRCLLLRCLQLLLSRLKKQQRVFCCLLLLLLRCLLLRCLLLLLLRCLLLLLLRCLLMLLLPAMNRAKAVVARHSKGRTFLASRHLEAPSSDCRLTVGGALLHRSHRWHRLHWPVWDNSIRQQGAVLSGPFARRHGAWLPLLLLPLLVLTLCATLCPHPLHHMFCWLKNTGAWWSEKAGMDNTSGREASQQHNNTQADVKPANNTTTPLTIFYWLIDTRLLEIFDHLLASVHTPRPACISILVCFEGARHDISLARGEADTFPLRNGWRCWFEGALASVFGEVVFQGEHLRAPRVRTFVFVCSLWLRPLALAFNLLHCLCKNFQPRNNSARCVAFHQELREDIVKRGRLLLKIRERFLLSQLCTADDVLWPATNGMLAQMGWLRLQS